MLSDTPEAVPARSFLALRGAITVDADTAAEVGARTTQLLETLFERNDLRHEELVSVFFTATPDIRSVAPAVAARMFGLTEVPLICVQEMAVDGSLPYCVRILAHLDTHKSKDDLRHVFLRGAVALRPELAEPGDEA